LDFIVSKINAMEEASKINQPNIINYEDKNAYLNKNLPESINTYKKNKLDIEFKKYLENLNNLSNNNNDNESNKSMDKNQNQLSFIQIKKYESIFIEEKYKPYFDFLKQKENEKLNLKKANNLNGSFIQNKSNGKSRKIIIKRL